MAKLPIGNLLKAVGLGGSTAALGGAIGYGLSSRHDFAVMRTRTPGGEIYLTGRKGDLKDLQEAAKEGNPQKFRQAASRVFVLGGGAQKAAGLKKEAKLPGLKTVLTGLAGAGVGAGLMYPYMRGQSFGVMNIQTPYGPLPVAGKRKDLEDIVEAAKERNEQEFQQAVRHVVPLHPAMAGAIAGASGKTPQQTKGAELTAAEKLASFFAANPWILG